MSSNIQLACNQRQRRIFFNSTFPNTRTESQSSPYINGFTETQLNMRRKAEILKYSGNASNTKTNGLTKKQKYSQVVSMNQATQTQLIMCDGPRPTSSSDVPGAVIDLYLDPTVPLYNYADPNSYNTNISDIVPVDQWTVFTTSNIAFIPQTTVELASLYILNTTNYASNIFSLTTPVSLTFGSTVVASYLTVSVLTYFYVYFGSSLLLTNDPTLVSQTPITVNTITENIQCSSGLVGKTVFVGNVNASNLFLYTPEGIILDITLKHFVSTTTTDFSSASNYSVTAITFSFVPISGITVYFNYLSVSYDGKYHVTNQYYFDQNYNTALSVDYGNTWSLLTIAGIDLTLYAITTVMSGNGKYWICNSTTFFYLSSDYGTTWTNIFGTQYIGSNAVAVYISYSGEYMYFCDFGVNVYRSSNYGVTWTVVGGTNGLYVGLFDASTDGKYVTFTIQKNLGSTPCDMYQSTDYGITFINYGTISNGSIATSTQHTSCSNDGQYKIFVNQSNDATICDLYLSKDSGSSWTSIYNITVVPIIDVSISQTGQYIAFIVNNSGIVNAKNGLYLSSDFGSTWQQLQSSTFFQNVNLKRDGFIYLTLLGQGSVCYEIISFITTYITDVIVTDNTTLLTSVGVTSSVTDVNIGFKMSALYN